jgi:hypothetical protein
MCTTSDSVKKYHYYSFMCTTYNSDSVKKIYADMNVVGVLYRRQ